MPVLVAVISYFCSTCILFSWKQCLSITISKSFSFILKPEGIYFLKRRNVLLFSVSGPKSNNFLNYDVVIKEVCEFSSVGTIISLYPFSLCLIILKVPCLSIRSSIYKTKLFLLLKSDINHQLPLKIFCLEKTFYRVTSLSELIVFPLTATFGVASFFCNFSICSFYNCL